MNHQSHWKCHKLSNSQVNRLQRNKDFFHLFFEYCTDGMCASIEILLRQFCRTDLEIRAIDGPQRRRDFISWFGFGHFNAWGKIRIFERNPDPLCLKIREKVSFNIASEASYVYILNGQKLIKNAKNGPFWRVFENLKLAVKQCYQTCQF